MSRLPLSLVCAAALALLSACGGAEEAETVVNDDPPPPGMVPVAGEGRPSTLEEATEGESDVALWRVSDEDTVIYLLGTVHLMQEGVEWRTEMIRAAFDRADAVFLEADVFSRGAQRAMGVLVSETAELDEGTLSGFYSTEEKERIEAALEALGLSLTQFDGFRPWFASMQVSVMALIAAGGDPASGADVVISRDMLQRGTPLRYLETAAEQIALLAAGDDEKDADYFLEMLDDIEEGEAYYADLMGAWYEGNVERVDYLINDAFEDYPEMRQRLLVDRNNSWAQQLDRVLTDEEGVFVVAVGAGHLAGDASLQDILRSRGYQVRRVKA